MGVVKGMKPKNKEPKYKEIIDKKPATPKRTGVYATIKMYEYDNGTVSVIPNGTLILEKCVPCLELLIADWKKAIEINGLQVQKVIEQETTNEPTL